MKRSVLFLLVFLVPFLVNGQGVGVGIKAGANFANQEVSNISVKTVTDYLAGAYVNINFTKKWGLTPEVLYTVYGTKWDDANVNLDYVAIPLMLRFKPVKFLSLEAGPQFSFLTKAHVENVGDVKDQLKNNDFGLAFGAGVHLPLGFNAGARYVLGFTNISDVSAESVKNRTFQLYVGWTIFGAK
jgi:Outer membrane protein beta-barrel domain